MIGIAALIVQAEDAFEQSSFTCAKKARKQSYFLTRSYRSIVAAI